MPPAVKPPPNKALILPRFSLAELIHACGLVRVTCEHLEEAVLVTTRGMAAHVRHLFAGVHNLRFQFVDSWSGAMEVVRRAEASGATIMPLPSYRESCPYAVAGMDRGLAHSRFKVSRESDDRQRALLTAVRHLVHGAAEYVVVHDEPSRELRRHLVPDGLTRVHVRDFPGTSPFDWIQAMDHAAQIHGIDSHFLQLADKLDLRAQKFCHAYVTHTPGRWIAGAYGKDVVMIFG